MANGLFARSAYIYTTISDACQLDNWKQNVLQSEYTFLFEENMPGNSGHLARA